MIKKKTSIVICIVLVVMEALFFSAVLIIQKREFDETNAHAVNVLSYGDYSLNDGLYYANSDTGGYCIKIQDNTVQFLCGSNRDSLVSLYEKEMTYKPGSKWYQEYDEWLNDKCDYWQAAKTYYPLRVVTNPDNVYLSCKLGFSPDGSNITAYSVLLEYVDEDHIKYNITDIYSTNNEDNYLIFTRLNSLAA